MLSKIFVLPCRKLQVGGGSQDWQRRWKLQPPRGWEGGWRRWRTCPARSRGPACSRRRRPTGPSTWSGRARPPVMTRWNVQTNLRGKVACFSHRLIIGRVPGRSQVEGRFCSHPGKPVAVTPHSPWHSLPLSLKKRAQTSRIVATTFFMLHFFSCLQQCCPHLSMLSMLSMLTWVCCRAEWWGWASC